MRRRTRKALFKVLIFLTLLVTIIYVTSPTTSQTPKFFPWTRINYITTSKSLPPPHGTCPGVSKTTKPILVVARMSTDSQTWLNHPSIKDKYHLCVYTADAPSSPGGAKDELKIPMNRGHEAMTYLTFIIDNYSSLSSSSSPSHNQALIFIHGSRFSWHNDHPTYDNLPLLTSLNTSSALAPHGYHNLRCDWSLSTCPADIKAQGSLETSMQAMLVPYDDRAVSDAALPGALREIFGKRGGEGEGEGVGLGREDKVRAQCCAQFIVSASSIKQHSKEEYIALRQWLLDGASNGKQVPGAASPSDRIAGRVLSYVWHILFMQIGMDGSGEGEGVNLAGLNGAACPSAEECYCRLYGRCRLSCGEGRCRGQYSVPKGLRLPEGWEENHGG